MTLDWGPDCTTSSETIGRRNARLDIRRLTFSDRGPHRRTSQVAMRVLPFALCATVQDKLNLVANRRVTSFQGKPGKPNPRSVNLVAHIQSNQHSRQRS